MKKQLKKQLESITRATEKSMNLFLKTEQFKVNPEKEILALSGIELEFRALWFKINHLAGLEEVAPKAILVVKHKNFPKGEVIPSSTLGLLALEKLPSNVKLKRIILTNKYDYVIKTKTNAQ